MESTIVIHLRGDQDQITRTIESIMPDDTESFTIEYITQGTEFLASITINSRSLSSAKETADDILACLGAASMALDILQ